MQQVYTPMGCGTSGDCVPVDSAATRDSSTLVSVWPPPRHADWYRHMAPAFESIERHAGGALSPGTTKTPAPERWCFCGSASRSRLRPLRGLWGTLLYVSLTLSRSAQNYMDRLTKRFVVVLYIYIGLARGSENPPT